jgi:hypothetical protein
VGRADQRAGALEANPADAPLRAREHTLLEALGLPSTKFNGLTWKRGRLEAVHVFNDDDWMNEAFEVAPIIERVFSLPMADGLRELRTGVVRWDHNAVDIPALLKGASTRPFAQRLERLFLGDISSDIDMDHHVIGDVRALSGFFPNLRWLKLHSGAATWSGPSNFEFGPLTLPKIETLIIETCAMSRARVGQVLGSALPSLVALELWFGSDNYGADATVADLRPLLDGQLLPTVRHLGLRNAEFTDELARALVGSKVAARVRSLDLSMGTMGAEGAEALATGAIAFPALERLDVSDNYLDEEDVLSLKRAFPNVAISGDTTKEGDERYVSVHE